jgi:hypothetical protein
VCNPFTLPPSSTLLLSFIKELFVKINDSKPFFAIKQKTFKIKFSLSKIRMVFVGRPVLWGLAYDGENGVTRTLDILKRELDLSMALAGCTSVDSIPAELVLSPKSKY